MATRTCKMPLVLVWIAALAVACRAAAPPPSGTASRNVGRTGPFIIGADISWIPEDEAEGAEYYDHAVRKDIFQILKEHQFNYVRLRVFVDPRSSRGYARMRDEAFCDLEHTKAMAKRAKAAGMGFLLDFHYSDTWADPSHQSKPFAWEKLSFPDLTEALRQHTQTVLAALKEQGTTPDMVQVGNEITHGMLWPDGHSDRFDNLAILLKAAIEEVRAVDPAIKIVIHHHHGANLEKVREWMEKLLGSKVEFDIIGLSCYRQNSEGDWNATLDDLSARYPKHDLLIAEYSGRKRYVNDLAFNAPNKKCLGTFIWEPTRHKEALFDKDGKNAGGGEPFNFTSEAAAAAKARAAQARPPAAGVQSSQEPAASPQRQRRNHGSRYDTNELIDLYPEIARQYGNARH